MYGGTKFCLGWWCTLLLIALEQKRPFFVEAVYWKKTHNSRPCRFLQAHQKGFFDAYDRREEQLFDSTIFGYCAAFKPPYTRAISADWVNTNGWSYVGEATIQYHGDGTPTDSPFWLWFWRRKRYWTQNALIKNNYICRNSELTAEVKLSGAHEAGLIFRARGTWDYWAVLVSSGGVKLVWVTEGRRKELKSCSGPMGEWTLIHVADQIADVSFSCGVGSEIKDEEREMDDVEEIADQHMGAAGLIAYGGGAQFRNVFFGPVDWTPDKGKIEKFKLTAKKVANPPEEETAQDLARSDLTGLLDNLMRWCPNPSLCGKDPYRPSPRPQ